MIIMDNLSEELIDPSTLVGMLPCGCAFVLVLSVMSKSRELVMITL
jgi:hypothetical protein